jgi:beta-glucosidase
METCPTIVSVKLLRPAVIPEIAEKAAGIIGEFEVKDSILLEAIWGKFSPSGKLPFELPRSMDAVKAQKSDTPFDSMQPLYPFGFGLSYE